MCANRWSRRTPITKTPAGEKIREKLWSDIWEEFLKLDGKLGPLKRRVL